MTKIKIGIIFGGQSSEHEVSIASAKSVMDALDKKKYDVVPIKISKTGKWSYLRFAQNPATNRAHTNGIENPTKFLNKLDIVFPLIHGTTGEDGGLQGFLEFLNIPYIGANVMDSALGMDKILQKHLFADSKLPIVKFLEISNSKFLISNDDNLRRIEKGSGFPCFVKPARCGSSVGISMVNPVRSRTRTSVSATSNGVNKAKNLKKALNLAKKYDSKVIVESAVLESREFECAVLGNENPKTSVVGEVISSGQFYDYNAKYIDGKSQTIIPAKISKQLSGKIRDLAIKAYRAIDCNGMARVDFLYNSKNKILYINEINTIPGFTSISMYPKLWEASGLPYPKLLDRLVKLGFERHKRKQKIYEKTLSKRLPQEKLSKPIFPKPTKRKETKTV